MIQRLLSELGRSTEGRVIRGGRLGGPGPAVLVVGGVHGDEPATVDAVLALGDRLAAGGGPEAPVWLVPALNPDGLARGAKNSARDVDLNRNFPASSFRTTHAPGYFPGEAPLSEPETRILAGLVDRPVAPGVGHPDDSDDSIVAVVAVHAPFACVNYDGPAEAWAQAVSGACGWPVRADIGYPTPGSLGSWLGRDRGLPVLTLELPAGPYDGFRAQADAALDEAVRPRKHATLAE